MQDFNDKIKIALQSKMQQIDDDDFAKRIVDTYLEKRQNIKNIHFLNFLSFIIGISTLVSSIGLTIVLSQNKGWINEIGINEQHGLILVVVSIIFLIYKLIDEFTIHHTAGKMVRTVR